MSGADVSASVLRPGARVLVTGAAGFLGLALVRNLAAHGLTPIGLVRRAEQASSIAARGGRPVVGDVLDPDAVARAAVDCVASVHLASAQNDERATEDRIARVRSDGARNVVRATARAGGHRSVLGSGYWVYRSNPGTIDEGSAVEPAGESRSNYDAEAAFREAGNAAGLDAIVVRPAMVYGDGAWFRPVVESIAAGTYRTIDDGRNLWSFVERDDTAEAFRVILGETRAAGLYNVADGSPAPWAEFAAFVAAGLGRPRPGSLARTQAEAQYGPVIANHLRANRAVEPHRLRELGWTPRYPSYRDGVPVVLESIRARQRTDAAAGGADV